MSLPEALQVSSDRKPVIAATRPDFGPSHVTALEQLIPGRRYVVHRQWLGSSGELTPPLSEEVELIERPEEPVDLREHHLKVMAIYRDGRRSAGVTAYSLSDVGLTTYPGGVWHQYGWVEDPSRAA